jgi:SNF family Na+-dependent transporter
MEGFLKYFFISSIGFCIIGGLGRKSENHGFDGAGGKHGILMEFMNLEIIMVSLGVGAFITLLFFLAIVFSDNK